MRYCVQQRLCVYGWEIQPSALRFAHPIQPGARRANAEERIISNRLQKFLPGYQKLVQKLGYPKDISDICEFAYSYMKTEEIGLSEFANIGLLMIQNKMYTSPQGKGPNVVVFSSEKIESRRIFQVPKGTKFHVGILIDKHVYHWLFGKHQRHQYGAIKTLMRGEGFTAKPMFYPITIKQ